MSQGAAERTPGKLRTGGISAGDSGGPANGGKPVTVFGVVITLLLVFPWVLVAVSFVGAALSAVARRWEWSGKEPARMRAPSAAYGPSVRGIPADDSRVDQYHASARRAA